MDMNMVGSGEGMRGEAGGGRPQTLGPRP